MSSAFPINRSSALLLTALALGACTTTSTLPRADSYDAGTAYGEAPASLFAGDAAVLSDEDIARILAYRYEPTQSVRIALLPLQGAGLAAAGEGAEQLEAADPLVSRLRSAPAVVEASYLPSILTPEKLSVPYLREAAARLQADLLLVFRSSCQEFARFRLFADDQSRAYCAVEAVLLDTRTGLVPFTSVSRQRFDSVRQSDDYSLDEARYRAEAAAVARALDEIADALVRFLGATS